MDSKQQHVFNVDASVFQPGMRLQSQLPLQQDHSYQHWNQGQQVQQNVDNHVVYQGNSHETTNKIDSSNSNMSHISATYPTSHLDTINTEMKETQHVTPQSKAQTESVTGFHASKITDKDTQNDAAFVSDKTIPILNGLEQENTENKDDDDWDSSPDTDQEINQKKTFKSSSIVAEQQQQEIVTQDNDTDTHLTENFTENIDDSNKKITKLKEPDARPHLNVVFIGHVDAGKSTTCGNILVLTGQVDPRMLEKYEREAKEKNRDTWFFAFIVDINEEERQKGKTVEVGRATFCLEKTRFTILDAPGHKGFVPNMIGGAAQADIAVLIISARKGEFETGFEKGGQTREHALLAKTLGVGQLIVAVNKMDDSTCNWSEDRFREIEKKLTPFLKGCGYNPAKDITFIPISGLSGQNLKYHATDSCFKDAHLASWYSKSQPTLFQVLDNMKLPERSEKDPLRIPLLEGFRDQGVSAIGKVESGTVFSGQSVILMPKKIKLKVLCVNINDEDVAYGKPGENVVLRVAGIEDDQISKGLVICSLDKPCPVVTTFKAQIMIVELLEHRPIMTAGYSCVMHAHTVCEECQITKLWESVDRASKKKKYNPQFVKGNSVVVCDIQLVQSICLESYEERPQLGRFTLRDEGKTIAIGKVLEIIE